MSTAHETAMRTVVNELLADPQWAQALASVLKKLRSGFWETEYIDICLQKWERFGYDIYDAYAFIEYHRRRIMGRLASCEIVIGDTPHADASPDNAAILRDRLFNPFKGGFFGGAGDSDGYLKWTEPIEMEFAQCGQFHLRGHTHNHGPQDCCVHSFYEIDPWQVELEVGYTQGCRTLAHLGDGRAVARWPYGSKSIYVLMERELVSRLCVNQKNKTALLQPFLFAEGQTALYSGSQTANSE